MKRSASGILFSGHVFSYTGFGTASRSYIHAFDRASIPMSVIDMDIQKKIAVPDAFVSSRLNRPIDPVVHLCHATPCEIEPMKPYFPKLVVLTTWETDTLPQRFVNTLNKVREVWVPCSFNLNTFSRQLTTPVFQIPHPVRTRRPSCFTRAQINRHLGLDENSFVFLTSGSWQERKNLAGVIEAFLRAFPDDPNAILFIKTFFHFTRDRLVREQVSAAIARANPADPCSAIARIKICSEFLPEEYVTALAQRANCHVSLHCGEGWCYPLFDAACDGTPVISTAYSGPMDYLDPRYHHLVRYDLVPAAREEQVMRFGFSPDMTWAAPDTLDAARQMREVYDHRQQATEQAAEGALLLKQKFAPEAIGLMASKRLEMLAEDRCLVA
jgi:glycosyltransferase involved in cell wall biosynthesis